MSESILEVSDLRVRYGRIPVVHGITFDIPRGSVVGLLGANGAGKTTTMRAIMGQRQMTGGVRFEGRELAGRPTHRISRFGIAMVPEGRQVFRSLTVLHNLRIGAVPTGAEWRQDDTLDEVLTLFPELGPLLKRPAGVLSGGQQQMLAVGRAMMAKPKLMILDEPSLGLAPLVIRRIYDAIRELRNRDMSILLAEQNAAMALTSVDYAYVMQTGLIVEAGDAAALSGSGRVEEIYLGRPIPAAESEV